jgi:hypothetical protein
MESAWINRSKNRYYHVSFTDDLFGGLHVELRWGSTVSCRHGGKEFFVNSMEEVEEVMSMLHKRRICRGYEVVRIPANR